MGDVLVGLCCFLVGSAVVLTFVAVIGHGLWLLAAAVFSGNTSARDRRPSRRESRDCISCGESYSHAYDRCPNCGLDPESSAATELRDLDATLRTLQRLCDDDKLPAKVYEAIQQRLDARRRTLLKRPEPMPAGNVESIERWFGADLGAALTIAERKQALAASRQLSVVELGELTPTALVGVARLQASVGMLSRACQVYQILLADHGDEEIVSEAAGDALRVACEAADWRLADAFAEYVNGKPRLLAEQPGLQELIERAGARGRSPARAAVAVVPEAAPSVALSSVVIVDEPVSAAPVVAPPETPIEPAARRRSFAEWIGVFMEERNILWGELIGGTLIVGCSVALVISLWQTLEEFPLFPFAILSAITTALFAAGFYTLHHWKLESTSRGLLLIGTLLVPLDFLVLAGLARGEEVGWLYYAAGAAGLAAFGWLLFRAARILIQTPLDVAAPTAWLTTAVMLVSAAAQLVAPTAVTAAETNPAILYFLTLIPVLVHAGALGWILTAMGRLDTWSIGRLVALWIALGSVTFACVVTLSFPLFATEELAAVLPKLAPALTVLGAPILIAGILAHQRLAGADEQRGMWQTVATGVGLAGLFVMFGGFAAGVESLPLRWLCGGLNIGILLTTAWLLRVPALHVPVQLYVAVLLVFGGSLDVDAIAREPATALRLSGLLVAQAGFAEALVRRHRRLDARYYAVGGGVSTVLAGVLIWFAGLPAGETALVLGVAALTWYAANLRWRHAEITYACSVVLTGAVFFGLRHASDLTLAHNVLWALLTAATVCLGASLLLRAAAIDWLHEAFQAPLQVFSVGASGCAAVMLTAEPFVRVLPWSSSSVACGWLAALWLTLAVVERWAWLFGAFQASLGFAWFFGASAWLTGHGWDWLEPHSLHIYAAGLALLSLTWEICRRLLANASVDAGKIARVQALLAPPFVPVDRIISGVLIVGQYLLAMMAVMWGVGRELSAAPDAWRAFPVEWQAHAFSPAAWMVLIVLAAVLGLWMRRAELGVPLVAFTILALTVPILAAGSWFDGEQRATASALRWGLSLCYGAASFLLWNRGRLGDAVPALAIRTLLNVGAVGPALLITLHVAVQQLGGGGIPGPEAVLFRAMGGPASLLIPLAFFSATLAGHGFRERLAYYLLAAGWLATLSSVGAYFLGLKQMGLLSDEPWITVGALLLAAGTLSAWSILWIGSAGWLERGEPNMSLLRSPLVTLNTFLGAACWSCVMLPALVWVMFFTSAEGRDWTVAGGAVGSWAVYALLATAACCTGWRRRGAIALHLLGILSLAAVVPAACSAERLFPGSSFPTLMVLLGLYACAWVWVNLFIDLADPPRWLRVSGAHAESVLYACLAGGLAVFLGSAALFRPAHAVASVQAIALTAFAAGVLAYQRRRDIWPQIATCLMMLAATIWSLHLDREISLVRLVQTNLAVLGVMMLLRIGLHRFAALPFVELTRTSIPFYVLAGMLGNLVLASFALVSLMLGADAPLAMLPLHRGIFPWTALAPTVAAAIWYTHRAWRGGTVHAAALAGLMLGVLAAGAADEHSDLPWIGHHVLTLSWTLLALGVMIASWASHANDGLGPRSWPADWRTGLSELLRRGFPEQASRGWVALCGGLVVALALWATWLEPATPYWSAGNTLAVSILLGAVAVWARTPVYVIGSGLLVNVIGFIFFSAWTQRHDLTPDAWLGYAVLTQVLSFAAAALSWSAIERQLRRWAIDLAHDLIPFTQVAILSGLIGLAIVVGAANGYHLTGIEVHLDDGFACICLGIVTAATLGDVWRPDRQRFTRFHLYVCGLLAVGLVLHAMDLPVTRWHWLATLLLAGYVFAIVLGHRLAWAWFAPAGDVRPGWFWPVQFVTVGVVTLLSVWITLSYGTLGERLGGALAGLMMAGAMFALVPIWSRIAPAEWRWPAELPHYAVLVLGWLVAAETWWAFLDMSLPVVWMQRDAAMLAVLMGTTLLYRFGLARWRPGSAWAGPGRAIAAVFAVASLALAIVLIGQELVSYDAIETRRTPLRIDLTVCSTLALLAMVVVAVYSALTKAADDFGIEGEWRSVYIYFAELLVVLLIAHVRLNVPALPPVLGRYWYLSVMLIALGGLAAGEYFTYRNLPVLAVPLRRTAIVIAFLPVAAFRLGPVAHWLDPVEKQIPGLQPFLNYLRRLHELYLMEALCWLFLGVFFSWLAHLRRSANLGIFAAVAVNCGLWVLLGHHDATTFLQRPQLWLIPLGLIVLVADYINRDRLGFWPSLSVRYVGLALIYLSSTIEMIKDGLGSSVFLPIALALLAVAGVMLGILFRVRAFLLSGFLALFVVVFAQIWHAAVDRGQTWVWWASGIILGVLILGLFALFEKHRNDVRNMLDGMKRWR